LTTALVKTTVPKVAAITSSAVGQSAVSRKAWLWTAREQASNNSANAPDSPARTRVRICALTSLSCPAPDSAFR
jgi:hypothetical protein